MEAAFYSLLHLAGVQLPWLHPSLSLQLQRTSWSHREPVMLAGKLALVLGGSARDYLVGCSFANAPPDAHAACNECLTLLRPSGGGHSAHDT